MNTITLHAAQIHRDTPNIRFHPVTIAHHPDVPPVVAVRQYLTATGCYPDQAQVALDEQHHWLTVAVEDDLRLTATVRFGTQPAWAQDKDQR